MTTATHKYVTVEVTPEAATLKIVGGIVKPISFETVRKWAVKTINAQFRGVYMQDSGENVELYADLHSKYILTGWNDFANWAARFYAEKQIMKIAELYYRTNGDPMISEIRREIGNELKAVVLQELNSAKAELDKDDE